MKVLMAWIGLTDLGASQGNAKSGLGPVGQVVTGQEFDRIFLLCNYEKSRMSGYRKWLATQTEVPVETQFINLDSPMNFGEIYKAVMTSIAGLKRQYGKDLSLVFHLSPGTSAMAAVWILVSKTLYPAELLQSSPEAGVQTASIPFEISAEFVPQMLRRADERLENASAKFDFAADFSDVVFQSPQMREVIEKAQIIALHNVPILLEGESGTGKELFARAIHRAGRNKDAPFIPVNCGAIPAELVESQLFGHRKGTFTGATENRVGFFKEANGGTIFLDEIGELPLAAQVKLLRVLQEKEITPIGASSPEKIEVRVISATNRNLFEEVATGNFREDLFYRLAVFPLLLPPLRERQGDITKLADYFLNKINEENTGVYWKDDKRLTPGARNILLNHRWMGNVRELQNTILRACVLSSKSIISDEEIRQFLFNTAPQKTEEILNRRLGEDFSLPDLIAGISSHYLNRALTESGQNKSKAAKLLGLSNYQTLDNWIKKYQL